MILSVICSELVFNKRDQAKVEPKISSSLWLFMLNLSQYLAQLDLDPFCKYYPRFKILGFFPAKEIKGQEMTITQAFMGLD